MEFNPLEEIRTSFTRVSLVRQHLRALFFVGCYEGEIWLHMNKIQSVLIFCYYSWKQNEPRFGCCVITTYLERESSQDILIKSFHTA